MNIEQIKFDEKGLVPAIIQDYYTKEVLTLAYMNKESLEITLRDKKTCFFSRSRQKLWLKGETSGNYQNVVSVKYDCDSDSLLIEVKKEGPACHTGSESCFFNSLFEAENYSNFSSEKLYKAFLNFFSTEVSSFFTHKLHSAKFLPLSHLCISELSDF